MPILMLTLFSVVVAWIRGAPPTRLADVRLRWMALPLVAFAIQALTFVRLEMALAAYAPWLHVASIALLVVFLASNLSYRSLGILAVGLALNAAVIGANGGFMPVRLSDVERIGLPDVAAEMGERGRFQKSEPLDERTLLPWLADVIYLPVPGSARMISPGDVFIAAGAFLFVQEALVGNRRRRAPGVAGRDALAEQPESTSAYI